MQVFLTIPDSHKTGNQRITRLEIPSVHICPGTNLILTCNGTPLRVPIAEVDINTKDGIPVLRIKEDFESRDILLQARELEWFSSASPL